MNAYQLTVNIGSRDVELLVKGGVIASIETGTQVDQKRTPTHKVNVLVNESAARPVAWIQIGDFDAAGSLKTTHEGFVVEGDGDIAAFAAGASRKATLTKLPSVPDKAIETHKRSEFGTMACCTSYGSGCYVTCCNSCCSDSTACPGASCCA